MSSVITRISETVLAAITVPEATASDNYEQIERRKQLENIQLFRALVVLILIVTLVIENKT